MAPRQHKQPLRAPATSSLTPQLVDLPALLLRQTQSELVARMGLSKQTVQQLLDGLEADGVVRRVADPDDRRGKRVVYTAKGLAALKDAVKVKRKLESEVREHLGERGLEALRGMLRELARVLG